MLMTFMPPWWLRHNADPIYKKLQHFTWWLELGTGVCREVEKQQVIFSSEIGQKDYDKLLSICLQQVIFVSLTGQKNYNKPDILLATNMSTNSNFLFPDWPREITNLILVVTNISTACYFLFPDLPKRLRQTWYRWLPTCEQIVIFLSLTDQKDYGKLDINGYQHINNK